MEEPFIKTMEDNFGSHNYFKLTIKYFPVIYFGFLVIYCLLLIIFGGNNIPVLAIAPYVYTIVVPILLFVAYPFLYLIAYYVYKDRIFKESIPRAVVMSGVIATMVIFIVVFLNADPIERYVGSVRIRRLYTFGAIDIIFIAISLMEIALLTYVSVESKTDEIGFIMDWFARLGWVGFIEVSLGVLTIMAAVSILPIIDDFDLANPMPIYLFLSFFYFVNAYLKLRMLRGASTQKDILQKYISKRQH
jgi:hypothetical protein